MTTECQQTIPSAYLQDFTNGDSNQKARFVQTIGEALKDIGFFSLGGHTIDDQLLAQCYEAAEAFFTLPESTKLQYEVPGISGDRGYTRFGKEQAIGASAPDLKEFWHIGLDKAPLPAGHQPNVWPAEVPSFQAPMLELYRRLEETAAEILRACALFLGEPENLLADMAIDGNTIIRVIHYPPIPDNREAASIRAAAHEDINFITLLVQSTASGLELLERDGSWRPVFTQQGHIVVDVGDMLQRLTNGYFRATTHRVVNPDNSKERRFSLPFFVHPRPEVSLAALPSCLAKTGEKRWSDCTAEEYRQERLSKIGLNK